MSRRAERLGEGQAAPWWTLTIGLTLGLGAIARLPWRGMRRPRRRMALRGPLMLVFGAAASLLAATQTLVFGRAIARARPVAPPIAIIGHHRTGSTHLHQLMALHPELCAPTSLECMGAAHMLVTHGFLSRVMGPFAPKRRPSDAMAFGMHLPQEEEFALLNLGAPTVYRRILLPSAGLTAAGAEGPALEAAHERFVRMLSLRHRKRLVLKSPLNTGRTAWLRRRYPGIRFVHLVREPAAILRSSLHLWHTLELDHGLERAPAVSPERTRFVEETFDWMYEAFWRDEPEIPAHDLITVRYEDLAARPREVLDEIAARLGLGPWGAELDAYLASVEDYRTNRFPPGALPQARPALLERYAERYGYAAPPVTPTPSRAARPARPQAPGAGPASDPRRSDRPR
ncbi:sulfotransferase [Albimonas sp. CAU 1670]|uniref:sulfotransferase family protein n=1 Tax=Albimonas sp. CAU 1670 TaxID=3032599 RepID=UPI0023DA39E8|nr:sulfotransferase [Albimonas sp. CAU 1670]MDF2235861.1 sulfotransferase [Albimonas sp. CAU 1670]